MTTATLVGPAASAIDRPDRSTTATGIRATARTTTASLATGARVALTGVAVSVPPVVLLHLDAPAGLSAAGTTISDYVVTAPFGEPLFALTTGGLAVAGIAIARALGRPPDRGIRQIQLMLAAWSVALVLAAVFPTNPPGTPSDLSSTIHLTAGAVVFALLPAAGVALWRRWRASTAGTGVGRTLLGTSLVGAVLSTALIVNRIPAAVGLDQLMLPPGLLQRAAGAVEIVLAAVIALALRRLTREPVRPLRPVAAAPRIGSPHPGFAH